MLTMIAFLLQITERDTPQEDHHSASHHPVGSLGYHDGKRLSAVPVRASDHHGERSVARIVWIDLLT